MAKKKGPGRPKIELDRKQLVSLALANVSFAQALMILEATDQIISPRAFKNYLKREFGRTWEQMRSSRLEYVKYRLVNDAVKKALAGNDKLHIFCLKNICGWSDNKFEAAREIQERYRPPESMVLSEDEVKRLQDQQADRDEDS